MRIILKIIVPVLGLMTALHGVRALADDVPVAPLATELAMGYEKAYVIANDFLKLIVVPEVGRLVYLSYQNSPNLLAQRKAERQKGQWAHLGGAWVWPMGQDHWSGIQGKDWPPLEGFGETPWQSRGWINADGTRNVLMYREYSAPYNIKLSFQIQLHPDDPSVHFKQRLDRFESGKYPMTLWNVVQVAYPETGFFPLSGEEPFEGGYLVMKGAVQSNQLTRCENVVEIDVSTSRELKLGGGPQAPWCAVHTKEHLLHFSIPALDPTASFPDGGCASQLYISGDQQFLELELLSEEKNLKPGESIEQEFLLQVGPKPDEGRPCEAVRWTP